jgi:hypothetical protein
MVYAATPDNPTSLHPIIGPAHIWANNITLVTAIIGVATAAAPRRRRKNGLTADNVQQCQALTQSHSGASGTSRHNTVRAVAH